VYDPFDTKGSEYLPNLSDESRLREQFGNRISDTNTVLKQIDV